MDDTVLRYVQQSVLCWLATADQDGMPNVTPKEIFRAYGRDKLLIANIASPRSLANIVVNPKVCVSFIDVFVQKGCKLKGVATVLRLGDADYASMAHGLAELAGERFPFSSLFAIQVQSAEPIVAPSYRLYPQTTEATQIESAMRAYGVQPRQGRPGS